MHATWWHKIHMSKSKLRFQIQQTQAQHSYREKVHLQKPDVDGRTNKIIYKRDLKERFWPCSASAGISGKLVWRGYQIIGCHRKSREYL